MRIRQLEKKAPGPEVIDMDAASKNVVAIYSAIEELHLETKVSWKKLVMPLDQVIEANNTSNQHLKLQDVDLTKQEDIMDGWVSNYWVCNSELQTKV